MTHASFSVHIARPQHRPAYLRVIDVTRVSLGLALGALLLHIPVAQASPLEGLRSHSAPESRSEIAFVLTGWVKAGDVDALAKCLATKNRRLPKTGDVQRAFSGLRWTPKALGALDRCNTKDCRFNFPKWASAQIAKASGRDAKIEAYFEVVRKLAWGVDKKKKRDRIMPYQVQGEVCSQHNLFHWLLNGPPKSWDRVIWRKHFGHNKRMRPTLEVLQRSHWTKGTHRCIGTTLLFADHYYNDAVELLDLTSLGGGKVAFRQYTRIRFDFFNSWWARRFRGTIRKAIQDQKIKILSQDLARCGVN